MEIEDTYAEAFSGFYSEILITARDRRWLLAAANSATGFATSGVGCTCEAGIDRILDPENTPDNRIGATLQFWIPSWGEDPVRKLELELIHRIGQCILTAPTTAVWNATESMETWGIGKKMGFFGDGFQTEEKRFGRDMVNIPRMMGEFLIEREIGYGKGIMGGNIWFLSTSEDSALEAAEKAAIAVNKIEGVVTAFPGGVCSAGSKVGSRYKFLIASTNEKFCPALRDRVENSKVPGNVNSISEIVFNGVSEGVMEKAMRLAVEAARDTEGLVRISAGNYGGRLGKYRIYLR